MLTLLLSRWKLAGTIILITGLSLSVFYYKTRYVSIVRDFDAYKASVAQQAKMQQLKNDILRKQAESSLKDAELTYDNNLKAIKNEYLKKQKLDNITIDDLRNRLRDQIRADSFTMPEAPTDTASAEEWRNSHSTVTRQYETLIDACRITTNDYNLLRDWADISCLQVGCEDVR